MYIEQHTSDFVNNMFENYNDSFEINGTKRMHPTIEEFSIVLEDLQLRKKDISIIRVEETKNPIAVPPHADTKEGFKTTLIPLKFIAPVSTILFESFYLGTNIKGYKYRPTNKRYYQDEWLSDDANNINNISNQKFDKEHYNKYLSYISINDLHGLTIQKIIKWKCNKAIIFPSHQLHSGSIFQQSKRWLLIISTNVS